MSSGNQRLQQQVTTLSRQLKEVTDELQQARAELAEMCQRVLLGELGHIINLVACKFVMREGAQPTSLRSLSVSAELHCLDKQQKQRWEEWQVFLRHHNTDLTHLLDLMTGVLCRTKPAHTSLAEMMGIQFADLVALARSGAVLSPRLQKFQQLVTLASLLTLPEHPLVWRPQRDIEEMIMQAVEEERGAHMAGNAEVEEHGCTQASHTESEEEYESEEEWDDDAPSRTIENLARSYTHTYRDLGSAAYWRPKEVAVCLDAETGVHCDRCKRDVKDAAVVCCDSSDGEYGPVCICEHCISKLANEVKGKARGMLAQSQGGAAGCLANGGDSVNGVPE